MKKNRKTRGFTLVELMVVILIVGILAAVAVPILRGKIDQAKWSEGAATAGAIRSAARAYFAENPTTAMADVGGLLDDTKAGRLGFNAGDLTGRYFTVGKFTIDSFSSDGHATVSVTAGTGLTGTGKLDNTAGWVYTPAS